MTTYPLHESARAIADANGIARVTLGPQRAFETWRVTRITVQAESTLVPVTRVFMGNESASNLVDGTHTGTLDHSDTNLELNTGNLMLVVFGTNEHPCDAGAQCTVTVQGKSVRS